MFLHVKGQQSVGDQFVDCVKEFKVFFVLIMPIRFGIIDFVVFYLAIELDTKCVKINSVGGLPNKECSWKLKLVVIISVWLRLMDFCYHRVC
jgi:hypothetical protein